MTSVHFDGAGEVPQPPAERPAQTPQEGDGGVQFHAAVQSHPLGFGEVQVDHLAAGVHAGVGPAGDGHPHLAPDQQRQCLFQHSLDCPEAGLHGPPAERSAVVRQIQSDTQKPAAPQNGGSGFLVVHRLKSMRRI